VVYDPVGGEVFDASLGCVAPEGRLLVVGFAGGRIPSVAIDDVLLKNISVVGVHWVLYERRAPELVEGWMDILFRLYEEGKLRPIVSRTYPLHDAAKALTAIANRQTYGKVLLVPEAAAPIDTPLFSEGG